MVIGRGRRYTLLLLERAGIHTIHALGDDQAPRTPALPGGRAPHQNCKTHGTGRGPTQTPIPLPEPRPTWTQNVRCARNRQFRPPKTVSGFRDTRCLLYSSCAPTHYGAISL